MPVTFSDGRGRASAMNEEMTLTLGGAHVGVVGLRREREASGTDFCSFCCISPNLLGLVCLNLIPTNCVTSFRKWL